MREALFRYGIASVAVAGATLLRMLIDSFLGDHEPYFTFYIAVVVAAWFGGWKQALLAVVLGSLSAFWFFVPPRQQIGFATTHDVVGFVAYLVAGLSIALLSAGMHSAWRRSVRAEALVREQEEQLRFIADHAPVFLIYCDKERRYRFVNAVFAEWLRLDPTQIIGKCVPEVIGQAAYQALRQHMDAALAGEHARFEVEIPQGGRPQWMLCQYVPELDVSGEVQGFVAVIHDITERKRLEAQLQDRARQLAEADRRKDEFLAMLAHELRNPLASIRNALQIMHKQSHDGHAGVRDAHGIIERQVETLSRLVDDLLDANRITRGKMRLQKEPLDVADIVARAIESSRPLIDAHRHQLNVTLPKEPLLVRADLTRMAQVLSNLLNNAAKYTPEGGRIDLTVEKRQREVVIGVRDTGMGIPAELLPKVFDLFTQVDRTLDRAEGGLGIGLTLVRRLTEMHGGTVEASSPGPGQGSEFVVRLPLLSKKPPTPASKASDPALQTKAACPHRILIIDDNRDAADSLAMLLRLAGHEVQTVYDGPRALALAEAYQPDLVLLDIGLPGMDGHEVAQRLRGERGLGKATLVALTGYGTEEDRQQSKVSGFDYHLVKPVDFDALQQLLATLDPV